MYNWQSCIALGKPHLLLRRKGAVNVRILTYVVKILHAYLQLFGDSTEILPFRIVPVTSIRRQEVQPLDPEFITLSTLHVAQNRHANEIL